MNFNKQAKTLETFLNDDLARIGTLLVLKDKSVVYKNYRVKRNKNGEWSINKNGSTLGVFNIKACAVIAAKLFDNNRIAELAGLRLLDSQIYNSTEDEYFYKQKLKSETDEFKLELFLSRWDLSHARARSFKKKLSTLFNSTFDK